MIMEQLVYSFTLEAIYKISSLIITVSNNVKPYFHQDRLGQLLSVDYFDGYLLTRNTMDPKFDQS